MIDSRQWENAIERECTQSRAAPQSLGLVLTHQLPKRSSDSVITATYLYNEGLVTGLNAGGASRVSNVTYHPHGGINAWTAGNGVRGVGVDRVFLYCGFAENASGRAVRSARIHD